MKFTSALAASALFAAPVFADLVVKHTVDGSTVKSEVTNTGTDAVTVADHPESVVGTEFKTDVFTFKSEKGEAPAFTGIALKWDPSSATGTVIEAGETKTFEQDIDDAYDFSKSGESTYTVTGGNKFYVIDEDGKLVPEVATVVPTSAKISATQVARRRNYTPVYGSLGKRVGPYFTGCSASQQTVIRKAAADAQLYVQDSLSAANNVHSNDHPRYKEWFGVWTPARSALVANHYSQLMNDATSEITNYDCSTCTRSGVYAYVYPNAPLKIYLCSVFWSAPATGTDSKAGTIVHEMSHFDQNGGTRDYAYGQPNARQLAISNPDTATMNADSHEYFAENTPHLTN